MNMRKIYYIMLGIIESFCCLLYGSISLIIISYIHLTFLEWLFFISAFALPFVINIMVLFKNRNEHAIDPFLSVASATTTSITFYFLDIYKIVGDFAYSLEYHSGWIDWNWDDFLLIVYTCICIFLLLIACFVNLMRQYFKRK